MSETVTIKLDKDDALILAQFCQRAFLERVEPFAEDKDEARKMTNSICRLGIELEKHGYSVR